MLSQRLTPGLQRDVLRYLKLEIRRQLSVSQVGYGAYQYSAVFAFYSLIDGSIVQNMICGEIFRYEEGHIKPPCFKRVSVVTTLL